MNHLNPEDRASRHVGKYQPIDTVSQFRRLEHARKFSLENIYEVPLIQLRMWFSHRKLRYPPPQNFVNNVIVES